MGETKPVDAIILTQKRSEGSVEDFEVIPVDASSSQMVQFTNLNTTYRIQVARLHPSLLLYEYDCLCAPVTQVQITSSSAIPNRAIKLPDGSHTVPLWDFNTYVNTVHYLEHTNVAIGRQEKKDYYRRFLHGDDEAATNYIRKLIGDSHSREILVIDPYMSGNDILKYLYFANKIPVSVKVLTSTSEPPQAGTAETAPVEEKDTPLNVIERRKKEISETLSVADHTGIDIEVRMQIGGRGTPLHDRLLIFPGSAINNVPPQAFSLGTSFNHVGQCFHVIIELPRPYPFVSEFYKMWNDLPADKYRVFKSTLTP